MVGTGADLMSEKRLADAADVAKRGSGQYQVRIQISRVSPP